MSKTVLNGLGSKTATFKDSLISFIINAVATAATLKLTIERDGVGEKTFIPTIKMGALVEAQDKIMFLTQRQNSIRRVDTVANDDAGTTEVFKNLVLDIGTDGEIKLNDSDEIVTKFSSLAKITADSYIEDVEGIVRGSNNISYNKVNYLQSQDKKPVSLVGVDFLVFTADKMPEAVELSVKGKSVKLSSENILAYQEETFGLIRKTYAANGDVTDHYGTVDAVLIDVRGADKCTVYDEAQGADFVFYTVNI